MPPVLQAPLIVRTLLVLLILAGAYFFSGFIVPVLAALIIGFASWPLHRRAVLWCGGHTALAATLSLLAVITVLVLPMSFGLHYALKEASSAITWLLQANRTGSPPPEWIEALPVVGEHLARYWREHLGEPQALGAWIELLSGEHLANIYRTLLSATRDLANLALTTLFMLITLFFVYKDGARIAAQVDVVGERILPQRWQRFSRVVPTTVSATVTGMGLIALGEGVVLGLAYWVVGVPSPVLLGAITGLMALIPGGAPLSFTLVSLYLIGSGQVGAGIGLFAWGTIELFIVDKTLRPRLIGGPVKLPFLPTFFGLVGGVKTMGLVGLFVGPVLMALLVAIWREWLHSAANAPADEEMTDVERTPRAARDSLPAAARSGTTEATTADSVPAAATTAVATTVRPS